MFGENEYLKAILEGKTIEVINKPVILDPDVFIPRRGILTRYGKKLLAQGGQYYKTVCIEDMVEDMQEIVHQQYEKEMRRFRSIDDEWGPSCED